MSHRAVFNFIMLRQDDIEKVVEYPKNLRDQIIIDFSRLQALRTREIATERWEYIHLEDGYIYVLDSKKHVLIPLPLHWRLAELLMDYKEQVTPAEHDWVIKPLPMVNVKKSAWGKPVSNEAIENVVKWYAKEVGVFNWNKYNPTLLRAYFAAEWIRRKRNLKMLQLMMRHNSLSTTIRYISKIVFWSELEAEFDRIQRIPTERRMDKIGLNEILENPIAKQCFQCPANLVCKHIDEAVQSEWAESCRFFPKILEKLLALKIEGVQQH